VRTLRLCYALVPICAALLVACGTANPTTPAPAAGGSAPAAQPSAKVTITFQHQFNDAESAKMQELVAKFEAANPNIHVELIRDNDKSYYDKLTTQMTAGAGPDIARVEPPKAAQYIAAGYAAPLDDIIPASDVSQFFPGTLEPLMKDGKLYGVPQDVAVLLLYYRSDLFQAAGITAPPKTWDELLADARKLTRAPDQYGIGLFGGWGAFEFYPWFWQAGGEMLKQVDGKWQPAFNSPEGVAALQFWSDLENKYKVMPPGMATATEDDVKGPFIAGKLAMFTSGPWSVDSLKKAGLDGKWSAAPLPVGKQAASVLGGMDLILLSNSKHKAEAGKFLAWLMEDSIQAEWAKSLNYLPIKQSMYGDPSFASDPLMAQFKAALAVARSRPTIPQAGEIDDAFGKAVQAALSGAQSPQAALDAAARQAADALAK